MTAARQVSREAVATRALEVAKVRGLSQSARADLVLELGALEALREVVPEEGVRTYLWEQAERELEFLVGNGFGSVGISEDEYPVYLATAHDAPLLMHFEGEHRRGDRGVAVVGSREIGERAAQVTGDVARVVGELGLSVVSGLAAGVDTAAHLAALDAGVRTVAVMGTDLTKTYPAENRALRQRIVAQGGEVMTQFATDAGNFGRAAFPMRNTTMSGLALATVIISAREKSGTRHQAQRAIRHGRPLVLLPQVVAETTWGKALEGEPDVYVAYSLSEVGERLKDISERDRILEAVLA